MRWTRPSTSMPLWGSASGWPTRRSPISPGRRCACPMAAGQQALGEAVEICRVSEAPPMERLPSRPPRSPAMTGDAGLSGLGCSHLARARTPVAPLDVEAHGLAGTKPVEVERAVKAAAMEEVLLPVIGRDESEAALEHDLLHLPSLHLVSPRLPEPWNQRTSPFREGMHDHERRPINGSVLQVSPQRTETKRECFPRRASAAPNLLQRSGREDVPAAFTLLEEAVAGYRSTGMRRHLAMAEVLLAAARDGRE
jgi:hypothetical protein